MNILFLFDLIIDPSKGGIERVTDILAKEFENSGHNVYFLACEKNHGSDLNKLSVHQFNINPESPYYKEQIRNLINDLKIDICINQSNQNIIFKFLYELHSLNIPIISVYHNQPFTIYNKTKIYKKLVRPKTIPGKMIKMLSLSFPKIYEKLRFHYDRKKINKIINYSDKFFLLDESYISRVQSLIPNVDVSKLDAINNPNTFKEEVNEKDLKENLIIFVGRLYDPQKNVKGFLEVWKNFELLNKKWKAIVIGDGPDKSFLIEYAKTLGLKNIEFIGNIKNIREFYKKAKIICMTSIYEGWPMVLPEALNYGCVPILYNSFEAAGKIVKNNLSGFLIKPFDKIEMVRKLYDLTNNELEREKMSQLCMKDIQKYDKYLISQIWLKKLQNLKDDKELRI